MSNMCFCKDFALLKWNIYVESMYMSVFSVDIICMSYVCICQEFALWKLNIYMSNMCICKEFALWKLNRCVACVYVRSLLCHN